MHVACYVQPNSHKFIQVVRMRDVTSEYCLNSSKRGKGSKFSEYRVNKRILKRILSAIALACFPKVDYDRQSSKPLIS